MNAEETDLLKTLVRERPDMRLSVPHCLDCGSYEVTLGSTRGTCVGGDPDPNHYWTSCQCRSCGFEWTLEKKLSETWYTKEGKVLAGWPNCYETYVYSCSTCASDVLRETIHKVSGLASGGYCVSYRDGAYISDSEYVYKCSDCQKEIRMDAR